MPLDTQDARNALEAHVPRILVLLCSDLATAVSGLGPSEIQKRLAGTNSGVEVRFVDNLCQRPSAIGCSVDEDADRLVLGFCTVQYSEFEAQTHAKRAGFDPLGIQMVSLGLGNGRSVRTLREFDLLAMPLLRAAVARANAFAGSQPENAKARLPSLAQPVSRRGLFTLLPVFYDTAPTIDRVRCVAFRGCGRCVEACPRDALTRDSKGIAVNRSACVSCGVCAEACPQRAVEFPGSSADEIEAQVSAFLEEEPPPAIAFVCRDAAGPLPEGWMPVPVACVGMIPVTAIMQAIAGGAPTIALSRCTESCPANLEELISHRVEYCRLLLRSLGEQYERVVFLKNSGQGQAQPPSVLAPLSLPKDEQLVRIFGAGAAARAVQCISAVYGVDTLTLEHPGSPLGLVEIDRETCTACHVCTAVCPTGALTSDTKDGTRTILFHPSLCSACGDCHSRCPERAAHAITCTAVTDLAQLSWGPRVAFAEEEVRCERCRKPFATRRMLARLAAVLGNDYDRQSMGRLCGDCRGATLTSGPC